ncbi:MAG: DHA2 family efflux MFS transporter permease subunit [Nitrospirae bacterium]|nr:DHA2 family efflux MFS transporter permease subunit [Nitrospirota bacterium]
MLPTLIEIIDTSVVNVSLEHIRGSLSAGVDESTWTITSYLVSNAIIIPLTGWLSRRFGRKRYLLFSIGLFTASSFMCGAAWNLQSLVFFRILQGIGGGAMQPISQSILLESFPPRQHGIAMAVFGVGIMFGPIVGPLMGGWLTDNWSWHWIFFINVPIGIISMFMVLFFISDPPYLKGKGLKVDYAGLGLLAISLGCLQVVLDKGQQEDWFASQFIVALTFISVVSLISFIINELRVENPIVNLRLFRQATFSAGNIVMFCAFFNLFGSIVLLPIYLQTLMGYTSTLSGLVLGPGGIATLIVMPIAGLLVTRVNPKTLLAFGIIVCSYSTYVMSQFNLYADFTTILWPRILLGIGMGSLFIPLTTMTMSGIRKEDMGDATSFYNLLRNLGGSFGVAFVATTLARRSQFHQGRLSEGFTQFDPAFQQAVSTIESTLRGAGADPATSSYGSLDILYKELIRQAAMLSFNDAFYIVSILMLLTLPLIFLMRRTKSAELPPMH